QQDHERARSLSSQATIDPINARLSKSNENITQAAAQKNPLPSVEQQSRERITPSEDRQLAVPAAKQLASAQLQKFNLLKE
ncbi:unnamed protein product, partial [Rotaria socialis]